VCIFWTTKVVLPPARHAPQVLCPRQTLKGECRLQTPHHVSVDDFVADKALFLMIACGEYEDKQLHCVQCGTRIKWEATFISAHRMAEQCVGTGTIVQVEIPYCPQCEEIPYPRGCFHVRDRQDVVAALLAA
jgi:hypothetical protein